MTASQLMPLMFFGIQTYSESEATGDEYLEHSTSSAAQHLGVFGMFGVGISALDSSGQFWTVLDSLHITLLLQSC